MVVEESEVCYWDGRVVLCPCHDMLGTVSGCYKSLSVSSATGLIASTGDGDW